MDHRSDKDLLEALIKGDESAFSIFLNRHLASVHSFALRLTNDKFLAEDISQEVFLKVYRSAWDYDARFPAKNWVLTIARNTSIDMIRSRKSWRETISDYNSSSAELEFAQNSRTAVETPEERMTRAQESQKVLNALQSIPENQRTAIILQYFEGLSVKGIAKVMNVSVSAVESLLIRAKRNLAKSLSNESQA
jgi:RNA polymerase sigma factor (sigma-70 family)